MPASVDTIHGVAFDASMLEKLFIPPTVRVFGKYALSSQNIGVIYVATPEHYNLLTDMSKFITFPGAPGNRTTVIYSPGMVGVIDGGTGKAPVLNKSFKAATEEGRATFTLIAKYKATKGAMAAKATKVSYAG